jgi:hypothetical protein
MSERADYIRGLRTLANLLSDHEGIRLPLYGRLLPMLLNPAGENALADARAVMSHMTAPIVDIEAGKDLVITGRLHDLLVKVHLPVSDVCEKRVTGVHRASDGSVHEITEWVIPAELRNAAGGEA